MANTIVASSKPKSQRKWYYTKPLHTSQKEFSAHLSKDLRKELGRRSLEVRRGDTVKVLRGGEKVFGKQGKITGIMRAKRMVFVEGIVRKKVDGTEKPIPLRPSNLLLVAIDTKDERRIMKNSGNRNATNQPKAALALANQNSEVKKNGK